MGERARGGWEETGSRDEGMDRDEPTSECGGRATDPVVWGLRNARPGQRVSVEAAGAAAAMLS